MANNNVKPTIVLDLGSGDTKAGLADSSEYPSCCIPTALLSNEDEPNPVEHGAIRDFDQVERLIGHVFTKELKVRPQEHPILFTQPPKNPQKDREKLGEILFERFDVPALYAEVHSVLTFYASGKSAGLIVESGHGVTTVVPILSGYAIADAILRLDVGGGDIDEYLSKALKEKGLDLSPAEATKVKEELCLVPGLGGATADEDSNEETYTLPDGRTIALGKERHEATDPLFNPALVEQYDTFGIHEMIFQSIFKCSLDLRREFAGNVILSGGNTLFRGLENRLRVELENRVPASMKVNVIADSERKVYVWRGGSILGSLSTFYKNICVTKGDYEENGVNIIRKKCSTGL